MGVESKKKIYSSHQGRSSSSTSPSSAAAVGAGVGEVVATWDEEGEGARVCAAGTPGGMVDAGMGDPEGRVGTTAVVATQTTYVITQKKKKVM